MENKRCSKCKKMKIVTNYYRNKKNKDGLDYVCKRCSRIRYYNELKNRNGLYGREKRIEEHWIYGNGDPTKNQKYLKDRAAFFATHGNGWWWGLDKISANRYPSGKAKPITSRKRFSGRFILEDQ